MEGIKLEFLKMKLNVMTRRIQSIKIYHPWFLRSCANTWPTKPIPAINIRFRELNSGVPVIRMTACLGAWPNLKAMEPDIWCNSITKYRNFEAQKVNGDSVTGRYSESARLFQLLKLTGTEGCLLIEAHSCYFNGLAGSVKPTSNRRTIKLINPKAQPTQIRMCRFFFIFNYKR